MSRRHSRAFSSSIGWYSSNFRGARTSLISFRYSRWRFPYEHSSILSFHPTLFFPVNLCESTKKFDAQLTAHAQLRSVGVDGAAAFQEVEHSRLRVKENNVLPEGRHMDYVACVKGWHDQLDGLCFAYRTALPTTDTSPIVSPAAVGTHSR